MKKTFNDCAVCEKVGICCAHVTDGQWDHTKGVDPCEFELSEKDTDWDEIFGIS